MSNRIVILSQKGGVGKTTIALNLAVALAEKGSRTLLVDLDPQGAIGHSLAVGETKFLGLTERLMDQATTEETIQKTKLDNLCLLPRGKLDPADIREFENALQVPGVLASVLDEADSAFEFTVIDTVSGLGSITRAAMAVSRFVLVPIQAEPLAVRSVGQVLRVIEHVVATENPELKLLGLLPVMVELNKEHSLNIVGQLWSGFAGVMDAVIPRVDVFAEASLRGLPVGFLAGKTPPEARRFELLAAEIETRISQIDQTGGVGDEQPQRELL